MDDWVIHKFGGSCLRTPGDLDQIHRRLLTSEGRPLIVVSALWGVTDRLLRAIGEPWQWSSLVNDLRRQHLRFTPELESGKHGPRFMNILEELAVELLRLCQDPEDEVCKASILASGERLASIMLIEAFQRRGLECSAVDSDVLGMMISENGSAIDIESSAECIDLSMFKERVAVVSGWFGKDVNGDIRVLDRGGSDLSAAALAQILEATRVILWKDVPGVLSVSPQWGIESQTIPYLGVEEALALARAGGVVLHAACIETLRGTGIPCEIRALHKDGPYTTIGPDMETDGMTITAISCTPGIIHHSIHTIGDRTGAVLNQVMELLKNEAVKVWFLKVGEGHISLFVPSSLTHSLMHTLDGFEVAWQKSDPASLFSLIGSNIEHDHPTAIATMSENHALHFLSDETDPGSLIQTLVKEFQLTT
tara:strand:+ start:71 stop:1339 length:1269 start_codon:yes stop_codon:yes gene_type:complete